jgi:hypothetical protein
LSKKVFAVKKHEKRRELIFQKKYDIIFIENQERNLK